MPCSLQSIAAAHSERLTATHWTENLSSPPLPENTETRTEPVKDERSRAAKWRCFKRFRRHSNGLVQLREAARWAPISARVNSVGESPSVCLWEPTSVESLAVGQEGELEEQRAQKVRSADDAGHLRDGREEEDQRRDSQRRAYRVENGGFCLDGGEDT